MAELTAYFIIKSFDEHIKFNFAYSNVWSNRITDEFEINEFEQCVTKITKFLDKITIKESEKPHEI